MMIAAPDSIHASGMSPNTPAWVNHVAFRVDDVAALEQAQKRVDLIDVTPSSASPTALQTPSQPRQTPIVQQVLNANDDL